MRQVIIVVAVAAIVLLAVVLYLRIAKHSVADDSERLWDARLAALQKAFGPYDDQHILTSPVPFHLDGGADVLIFRSHVAGIAYVTAALIGDDRSKPNKLGQYELMMCLRKEADWAPEVLSSLAKYTIESVLQPGETMDIAPGLPQPSNISHLLFVDYAKVTVEGKPGGVLLCLGITQEEYHCLHTKGYDALITKLKQANAYPFTELTRSSVSCDE